jgi:hypothetical protein
LLVKVRLGKDAFIRKMILMLMFIEICELCNVRLGKVSLGKVRLG